MSLVVDEHRQYLDDPVRLAAFDRAVRARVAPGSVVLDLASGTGILGLMACRAGAARVYSIESGGMVEVARSVAAANGYGDRVRFIKGFSLHAALPERVDVVIADQIGNFGFNAGVVEYFADARARFLKPEGHLVPEGLKLNLAPVESEALDAQVSFWASRPGGFAFDPVSELAANTGYQVELSPAQVVGAPVVLAHIPLGEPPALIRGRVTLKADRAVTLHGLGGWFEAVLAPGVTMTNSPLSDARIRRRQVFFPLRPSARLAAGAEVEVEMTIQPREGLVSWRAASRAGGPASVRHSTWKGMLLNREDLGRTRPDFKPVLNARGEARRTVVDLCDGSRSVRDIEEEVWRRHGGLFASRSEAEEFVAEVVTRYAT